MLLLSRHPRLRTSPDSRYDDCSTKNGMMMAPPQRLYFLFWACRDADGVQAKEDFVVNGLKPISQEARHRAGADLL